MCSSQKSQKSEVINIDEDTDNSPSKQLHMRKNLEESSFLPDHVPVAKSEKKRKIIKKVRFHDYEPEHVESMSDYEQSSEEFKVKQTRKRQMIDDSFESEHIQPRSKRPKLEEQVKKTYTEDHSS